MAQQPDLMTADPLAILRHCDGYYECPKDGDGNRLGPLVGYAGKDSKGRQFVGDVYVNYAVAEYNPVVNAAFAERLRNEFDVSIWNAIHCFCGAPMGGLSLAQQLALLHYYKANYIYPEKEITALATQTSREQSRMVFKRHTIRPGANVAIVEDVLNNFSTTDELIEQILNAGGNILAIVGFLNRSTKVNEFFSSKFLTHPIPVICLVRKLFKQYEQDDPAVALDIQKGNVVFKPKHDWSKLQSAMDKVSKL